MLENIVKGFEEMMNSIMAVFNESYNDKYAGWNEGEELLMLNDVWYPLMDSDRKTGVWKHALFSFFYFRIGRNEAARNFPCALWKDVFRI